MPLTRKSTSSYTGAACKSCPVDWAFTSQLEHLLCIAKDVNTYLGTREPRSGVKAVACDVTKAQHSPMEYSTGPSIGKPSTKHVGPGGGPLPRLRILPESDICVSNMTYEVQPCASNPPWIRKSKAACGKLQVEIEARSTNKTRKERC